MAEVEPEPEPEIQQNSGSQPAGEKSLSRFIASEDCSKRKQMCITVAVSGSILVSSSAHSDIFHQKHY